MACERERFHAFHNNLACCIQCGFHSKKSTDILEDGCILSETSVHCPQGHELFKRECKECGEPYKGFHRHRNAVKCMQCDYPVRVFDLPDEDYDLSEEQRDLITCTGCGNNSTKYLFLMPYDDNEGVLGVYCLQCGSCFIACNKEEATFRDEFAEIIDRKPEPCYKREPIVSDDQIQPLDHIETHSTAVGVLPYEHHLVVAMTSPDERKFYAYEYLKKSICFSEYSFDDILKTQSFRYIYDKKSCLSEEDQHRRAEMRMGESAYNLITNNCEKYARWIKTGISETLQPKRAAASVLKPLVRTAGIILMQALTEVATHSMRTEVLGWGGIGIVSIAWLTYKYRQLNGQLEEERDRGSITDKESSFIFKNEMIMEGSKTAGTAIGAAVGGLLTIPFGGLGFVLAGAFGCLDSLLGSFVGATAGRSIGNKIVAHEKEKEFVL